MGCVNCYYYPLSYQELKCGCVMCLNCYNPDEHHQQYCKICN